MVLTEESPHSNRDEHTLINATPETESPNVMGTQDSGNSILESSVLVLAVCMVSLWGSGGLITASLELMVVVQPASRAFTSDFSLCIPMEA